MLISKRIVTLVLAGCFISVSAASADQIMPYNQHTGFYLSLNTIPPVTGAFYAGYMLTPHWGVEAGVDAVWGWELLGDTVTAEMVHLDVKGVLPLGSRAELFGKLGLGVVHARADDELFGDTESSTGVGPAFGLGFGYDFTPKWIATVEANGMIYPDSSVLSGNVGVIPTIGITHYFS